MPRFQAAGLAIARAVRQRVDMGRGFRIIGWSLSIACALVPVAASAEDIVAADMGQGTASYFSREMAGNRTANGERCDPDTLTAAHRTAPFGSRMRVTSTASGRSVVVRINDRGPFSGGRVIDLSRAASDAIGLTAKGRGPVRLELLAD